MNMSNDMRGIFFIVKGQYRNTPNKVNGVDIGGYDPESDKTNEWYMLLDCKTFHCISCGSDLDKVVRGVYTTIKRFKGKAKSYFKHVSNVTSEDYYDVEYLGKRPMNESERKKRSVGKCPRVSPAMKTLYGEVYNAYGDFFSEEIEEMEDLAYGELKNSTPFKKTQKLMKKTNKGVIKNTTPKTPEVVEERPKTLVKPKAKLGVKKLKLS